MQGIEVTYKGHYGDDLEHVNAARVSFGRESSLIDGKLKEGDKRLLQFLARGISSDDWETLLHELEHCDAEKISDVLWQWRDIAEHRSPFNHSFISLHIKAPIFVARQLVKHEYMPWNEMSGRYIEFKEDSFFKPEEYRSKVRDKKQGSGEPIEGGNKRLLDIIFNDNHYETFQRYKYALERGLCEEQARGLLPLNLLTEWRWSGTFGAWAKVLRHRLASDAQKETQEVARLCGEIIKPLFPVSYESLVERKF